MKSSVRKHAGRAWPKILLTVASLGLVGVVALGNLGRKAPGPLTTVHARVPELVGWNSCSNCHGGWTGTMTAACLDCHEPIDSQLAAGDGLHGSLDPEHAKQCQVCHSEHHGADFQMVNRASFAAMGIASQQDFDHARVGFQLEGAHTEQACADCHEHADTPVLPEGAHRFLGASRECASCHDDPHEGAHDALGCADCHGQTDFEQLEPRRHDRFLPLVGAHGALDCASCHAEGDAHGFAALGGGTAPASRTCVSCHDNPHSESFAPASADCASCHASEHLAFADSIPAMELAAHAASGFALDAPHDEASCADCHGEPETASFTKRHPGRRADDCAACHDDPHGGQFADSAFAADVGCVACHERTHFDPPGFDREAHASSRFPLEGSHELLECDACHERQSEQAPRTFRGTPLHCDRCHADAHDGHFDPHAAALDDRSPHGRCDVCHEPSAFANVDHEAFDHEAWTGFAIRGAHAAAGCAACHPRAEQADPETGRRFGRVRDHFGAVQGCVTCHEDPHRGRFDDRGLPQVVDGRQDCARCHSDVTFRAVRDDWDHTTWTGFELEGRHADAACADCHEPRWEPDQHGRTWERAKGTRCADCHVDPHAGQFDRAAKTRRRGSNDVAAFTDCARCHDARASDFAPHGFDHDTDSAFQLGPSHQQLACAACHKPDQSLAEDGRVIRYRPLPRDCRGCHGDQRNPLRRERGNR